MTFISLTITKSPYEIISGIPEYVTVESNVQSLIYYTVDGTLPTAFSTPYDGYLALLPTSETHVTFSAVAYFMDGYGHLVPSSVFSETYNLPQAQGNWVRNFPFQGVSYMRPGGLDIPFWYDSEGDALVYIDIPLEEFEGQLIPSETDADGTPRPGPIDGARVPYNPDRVIEEYVSHPEFNVNFNPAASMIVIDGRGPKDPDEPLVLNSPFMSLRDPEKNFGGVDFMNVGGGGHSSGSLTKAHYNREKGNVVFYYFDSNTGRWIKSIQNLPKVEQKGSGHAATFPQVIPWNVYGRQQGV